MVSTGGGHAVAWRRDGRELFYLAPDGRVMSVAVGREGNRVNFAKPVPIFRPSFQLRDGSAFDLSADGRKFLASIPIDTPPQALTVLNNWTVLLKK